ncbi:MAG TPA: hypothetical protein VLA93_11120 [Pyrinomonadaceae bacterium]|nr:hypothetical protein [Pyrinomonadaceae bacterium]
MLHSFRSATRARSERGGMILLHNQMLLVVFLLLFTPASQDPNNQQIADPRQFDEWGDMVFSEEKARLDNVAIHWKEQPQSIIYLIVYAGKKSCVGEATARGLRAKKYLIKHNVQSIEVARGKFFGNTRISAR